MEQIQVADPGSGSWELVQESRARLDVEGHIACSISNGQIYADLERLCVAGSTIPTKTDETLVKTRSCLIPLVSPADPGLGRRPGQVQCDGPA